MSFIEGIGDEVTLFFVIVVVFVLAALVTLIGNRPSFSSIRARQSSRRAPDQDSQTLRQNPEVFTTAIERTTTVPARSVHAESFEDFINEGTADVDNEASGDNEDTGNTEEEGADESTRTEANTIETEDTTVVDDSEPLNSSVPSAPPLEDHIANGTTELPQPPPGEIRIRLKYLDDTERTVTSSPNTKVGDFKNKHFGEDIRNNKVVRLIFAGRLLHNASTLQNCRVLDNSVVHVQILQAPTAQHAPAVNREGDLDLGRLLWPMLTFILGLCWITYFKYPEFYNMMSLGMLLLFTGSFFYFLSQTQH